VKAAHAELLARFDEQARAGLLPEPGMEIERTPLAVRLSGMWDLVLFSRLTPETADAEIARQQARPLPPGRKLEWKLYAYDEPKDMEARLRRAGFAPEARETVLVLDLDAALPAVEPPAGIRIERATDAAGLAALAAVGVGAFGVDYAGMNDEFLARMGFGTVSCYVAYSGAEPVCAGRLETPRGCTFAGLYGGGTAPAYRGRGIYRSLVAARVREAKQRGYRYVTVDAADTSLPILLRLGFEQLTTVRAWTWQPSERG
jgi:GNAT superfamily N-acetyltransferase